jgi:hypothetical protein
MDSVLYAATAAIRNQHILPLVKTSAVQLFRVLNPLSKHKYTLISHSLRMASSGMLLRVALVRTEVSEELSASFIRATRIG